MMIRDHKHLMGLKSMWKWNANGKRFIFEKLQWNSVTTINIKMINFDDYVNGIAFNENKTKHNKNWPYIPDN